MARCLEHEVDHLDGIVYLRRLDPETRRAAMRAVRASGWFRPDQLPRAGLSRRDGQGSRAHAAHAHGCHQVGAVTAEPDTSRRHGERVVPGEVAAVNPALADP